MWIGLSKNLITAIRTNRGRIQKTRLDAPYWSFREYWINRNLFTNLKRTKSHIDDFVRYLCVPSMALNLAVKVRYGGTYQPTISEAQAIRREARSGESV